MNPGAKISRSRVAAAALLRSCTAIFARRPRAVGTSVRGGCATRGHWLDRDHPDHPVDLNSLLYGLEEAIRAGCERAQQGSCALEFAHRAAARRRAIDRYLWDARRGIYADYRWNDAEHTAVLSAATLYPLFESLASAEQATRVAAAVRVALLGPGGLVTSTLNTGQQWDAPNGWAPLQWICRQGAARLKRRTARRSHRLPLARHRRDCISAHGQTGGEI